MKHDAVLGAVAILLAVWVLVQASVDLHHGALFSCRHPILARDVHGQMEIVSTFAWLH